MKTIKQLLSVFYDKPSEYTFQQLVSMQAGLKELSQGAPTIVQINEMSKYFLSASDSASAGSDVMAMLSDLISSDIGTQTWTTETPDEPSRLMIDISTESDLDEAMECGILQLFAFYCGVKIPDGADWSAAASALLGHGTEQQVTVCTANGYPVRLSVQPNGSFTISVYKLSHDSYGTTVSGRFSPNLLYLEPRTFGIDVPDLGVISFESIAADLANTYADSSCISDVLSNLSYYGQMSKERLTNILDTYGNCDAALYLKDAIGTMSENGFINVFALIAEYVNGAKGSYNEGDSYFSPVSNPSYTTSVIAVVASAIIAIISMVLSTVFKSLGAIIALVISTLLNLISSVANKLDQTTFHIIGSGPSLIPTWNKPLYTKEDVLLPADAYLYEGVTEALSDYGCCALLPVSNANFCYIVGKSGENTCFTQLLPLAYRADGTHFGSGDIVTKIGSTSASYTIETLFQHGAQPWNGSVDQTDSWLTMTDEEARRSLTQLILQMLYFSAAADSKPDVGKTSITITDEQFLLLGNNKFNDFYTSVILDQPTVSSELLFRLMYLKLVTSNPLDPSVSRDPSYKIINPYVTEEDSLRDTGGANRSGMSWETLVNVIDGLGGLWKIMLNNYIKGNPLAIVPRHDYYLAPGVAALTPSLQLPTVSQKALLTAVIVAAVSAVAVTAVTITVKRTRRAKAVSRITEREAAFSSAQSEYKLNPTAKNRSKLDRANRRLTRAWTKAGKVGVTSYNGFATSTSPAAVPSTTQKIGSLLADAQGAQTDSLTISDILCAITGYLDTQQ